MKVCVFGVGRSGTTAIYKLLQDLLSENGNKSLALHYEPFLWDKDLNSDPRYFKFLDSISWEGLFNHLKLPLFIDDPNPFLPNQFLQDLFSNQPRYEHIILKFIRANGRYLLLKKLCPECRFIFIIRNPADVINSLRYRFSFYGGEFHKDDLPRFTNEVEKHFNRKIDHEVKKPTLEHEYLFWYYMNKFALESFKLVDDPPFIIVLEEYLSRRNEILKGLCRFIGIPYRNEYDDLTHKPVGPVTMINDCTLEEYEEYSAYLNDYKGLLDDYKLYSGFDPLLILKKYNIKEISEYENKFYGCNALYISTEYGKLEKEIRLLQDEINKLKNKP
jgi:hypothetical protein